MKVVITRKEHNCSFEGCCSGKVIKAGTVAITTVYKEGNFRNTYHFHPECHTQFVFNNRDKRIKEKEDILARRMGRKSDRPQGRPRKYTNPLKARNLKQLLRHHKEAGNWDRVKELEIKIKEMEVKQ